MSDLIFVFFGIGTIVTIHFWLIIRRLNFIEEKINALESENRDKENSLE